MNWDDLRLVLAIYKAGSINGAAVHLQVNSTTVSRRLKVIETTTKVRLFEKLRDKAVLTPAGLDVIETAEKIEALTHDLSARVAGLDERLDGSIRITSIDALLKHWMPDLLQFQHRHPGIDLELLSSHELANLSKREADIAIRFAAKAPEHLIGSRYAELFYAVYVHKDCYEGGDDNQLYSNLPWISWDYSVGRQTDNFLQKHHKKAKVCMRVDRIDVMVEAIAAGLGISILPCFIGDRISAIKRIGSYFEGGNYLWILSHPDLRSSARISVFTQFARELIARDKDLFEGQRFG